MTRPVTMEDLERLRELTDTEGLRPVRVAHGAGGEEWIRQNFPRMKPRELPFHAPVYALCGLTMVYDPHLPDGEIQIQDAHGVVLARTRVEMPR